MERSTAMIENELMTFLLTAYSRLFREYTFFTAAMLASCAIIPIFVVWMLNRRDRAYVRAGTPFKAYTHKDTTPLFIHVTVEIMMPVFAARALYYCLRSWPTTNIVLIVFGILLLLLAVLAVVGLFKFRVFGLIFLGVYVFCYAAFEQYQNFLIVAADMQDRGKYTPVNQYALYVVNDYLITKSMAISFVALVVLTLLAVYYYKRRFLFMPGKLKFPSCEYCGQVISKGDIFCTCCGRRLRVNPTKQVIMPLDQKPHCSKCGAYTRNSVCSKCNNTVSDYAKKVAKEKAGELTHSVLRSVALVATVVILIILASDSLNVDLISGIGRVSSAFVERWAEFDDDPDRAFDHEWLAGFDSAAEALYQFDARWQSVKPRSVKSSSLAFYMAYTDASFQQMEVLEQSVENVHRAAQGEMTVDEIRAELIELENAFNQTVDLQESAKSYYGLISLQWDFLGSFGYICLDAARRFLPFVNIILVSIFLITGCIVMLTYMLNGFSRTTITELEQQLQKVRTKAEIHGRKHTFVQFAANQTDLLHRMAVAGKNCWICLVRLANELWLLILHLFGTIGLFLSLFSPKNIGGFIHWAKAGLTDARRVQTGSFSAYRREQRIAFIAAIIIVAGFIGIFAFVASRYPTYVDDSLVEQNYIYAAAEATNVYAVDISNALSEICNTGTLTEEDKEWFYSLIDRQIEADEVILAYDMTGLDDYQVLHSGLQSMCKDDIEALQRIKDAIEAGFVPSRELQNNYVSIRGANYLWLVKDVDEKLIEISVMAVID